jgi:hypothetical protein
VIGRAGRTVPATGISDWSGRRQLSDEDALLCECARVELDDSGAERVGRLLARPLDWRRLLRRASVHGDTSLLAWLARRLDGIAGRTRDELQDHLRRNTRHNVALAGELLRLDTLLRDHGIIALPFKGPALTAMLYGHLGLREFVDLDLLVRTHDVPTACRALETDGYRPSIELTPAQKSAYVRTRYDFAFRRAGDTLAVELHWRIVPAHFGVRLDYPGLWDRCGETSLAGRPVSTLSNEDLLIALAVHGTKHLWERLTWVTDIAELLRKAPGLDWDDLWRRAEDSRSQRMLGVALALAVDLLDAPLPAEVVRRALSDRGVNPLVCEVERRLSEPPSTLWNDASFHIRAHRYRRDRWWYLAGFVVATTPADWAVVPLPRRLFPLYYLIRLVRVVAKYGGAATRALPRHRLRWRSRGRS